MICDNRMEVPRQDFSRTYPTRPLTQQSDQQDCSDRELWRPAVAAALEDEKDNIPTSSSGAHAAVSC